MKSSKSSQFFTLILVGVFAILAGLIVGLFGTAEWASSEDSMGPLSGEVMSHLEKDKEVSTGQRAQKKMVTVTEIQISYELQGKEENFSVDRSPPLAETQFPIGQAVDVYRIGDRATLTPDDDLVFGPTLIFVGFGVVALGLVIVVFGASGLRRHLRTSP